MLSLLAYKICSVLAWQVNDYFMYLCGVISREFSKKFLKNISGQKYHRWGLNSDTLWSPYFWKNSHSILRMTVLYQASSTKVSPWATLKIFIISFPSINSHSINFFPSVLYSKFGGATGTNRLTYTWLGAPSW